MKTTLFNGCSFVWGDELQNPIESRFSRLFSEQTCTQEVNISIRGASNDRIYRTTLDYLQMNPSPVAVIIVWSGIDRFEYIDHQERDQHDFYYLQCSPSRIHQREFRPRRRALMGYMSDIRTDYKSSIDTINYMCEVQFICESLNIPLLQYQFANRHHTVVDTIVNTIPSNIRESKFLEYYKSKLDYLKPYSTLGLTNEDDLMQIAVELSDIELRANYYGHPLEKSQIVFKDMMIKSLKDHHNLNFSELL